MRRVIAIIFLYLALATAALPYTHQSQPLRYDYKVTGRVIYNKSQTKKGATVYVLSNRPVGGRIPFTHADKDGKFSIEFTDVPGEYIVYAHEGETGGMLPLAATPEAAKKMQVKQGESKPIEFNQEKREQRVTIRLR